MRTIEFPTRAADIDFWRKSLDEFMRSREFVNLTFVRRKAVQRYRVALDYLASAHRMAETGEDETTIKQIHR